MKTLTEQQVREIIREEMNKNYMSGSPNIPPHTHNGTDGLNINPIELEGFSPQPFTNKKYQNEDGTYEYGFASNAKLTPGGAGIEPQYVQNPSVSMYPIPVVVGNGVGIRSAFNGGYAPEGTMVFFGNGTTLSRLYVRFDGSWYEFTPSGVI